MGFFFSLSSGEQGGTEVGSYCELDPAFVSVTKKPLIRLERGGALFASLRLEKRRGGGGGVC